MSSIGADLDPHFVKCLGLLYQCRTLKRNDRNPFQTHLEEAIFEEYGIVQDCTDLFRREKSENVDVDMELDLMRADLLCIVCNTMDVGVHNRLLECRDCHSLYHQACHCPSVKDEACTETWKCEKCIGKLELSSIKDV